MQAPPNFAGRQGPHGGKGRRDGEVQRAPWPCASTSATSPQTVKPPAKFKRKTVYFLKLQDGKLDNESITKQVRRGVHSPLGLDS
jgi:hypothetical protein